jgi:hypothetical protein
MNINSDKSICVINGHTFIIHGKNSKRAKEIARDPAMQRKLEKGKERLRNCPIPEELIEKMLASKKGRL